MITIVDTIHFGILKQLIKMNYQKELSLGIIHAATAMSLLLPCDPGKTVQTGYLFSNLEGWMVFT